jgi:hypothetical protein
MLITPQNPAINDPAINAPEISSLHIIRIYKKNDGKMMDR